MNINCKFALCLAFCAVSVPAVAQQEDVIVFQPSSGWGLDYGDEVCALFRSFTSTEGDLTLQFNFRALGYDFTPMVLATSSMAWQGTDLTMRFDPDDEMYRPSDVRKADLPNDLEGLFFTGTWLPSSRNPAIVSGLDGRMSKEDFKARESEITHLTIAGVTERPLSLETGPINQAMSAVADCMMDLYASWGMDVSTLGEVDQSAERVEFGSWASKITQGYPRSVLRGRKSAAVTIIVLVGSDGRAAACHAHSPEPFPEFEEVTCSSVLENAQYAPARNADGQPVASIDLIEISYSPD